MERHAFHHRVIRYVRRSFAVGAALTAAGLMAGTHPAHAEKIVIGYMPILNQAEAVSEYLGLYKKYGLEVELKLFQNGPASLRALLSGDVQVSEAGVVPMLNMAGQGLPVYYLTSGGITTPEYPGGTIMIRNGDTTTRSFKDLKGKQIGQLGKGTNTYFWLWNATNKFGMQRSDLKEVFVPFPQMGDLLASKQVDAVYAWPPFDTLIAKSGRGKLLVDDAAWNPYTVVNAIAVRRDWADKNPDTVKKIVKITIETNRWINDNPYKAREILGKNIKLPEDVYKTMRLSYFPRNGYQMMPSIWDFYHLMVSTGEFQAFPDPKAVFDRYWIEPARKFIAPALHDLGLQDDPTVKKALKIKLQNLPQPLEAYLAPWERDEPLRSGN